MVFRFLTLDFSQDINTIFPHDLPSSPESTVCFSLGDSCTRPITARVAAGVSQLFSAPRPDPADHNKKKKKEPEEPPCIPSSSIIDLQFPGQKQLISFTYQKLERATDKFSKKNIVGRGGFGTVYRGRLPSGYSVAVKRWDHGSSQGLAEFQAEVRIGQMVMHRNVIPLVGSCEDKRSNEFLLVYPFMENGTLPSHLNSKRPESQLPMDWKTRTHVALGVARGLSYLHNNCFQRIVHRDIKPSNILLDENLEPLIGDFGLASFRSHNVPFWNIRVPGQPNAPLNDHFDPWTTKKIIGTHGYLAPEYMFHGMCSEKNDVFAYGIMLLELISGCNLSELHRLAKSEGLSHPSELFIWVSNSELLDWVKRVLYSGDFERIIDRSTRGGYSKTAAETLIKLSLICTQSPSPEKRPNMFEVVSILEGSSSLDMRWAEFEKDWDKYEQSLRRSLDQPSCSSSCISFAYSASHLVPEELSGPR